MINMNGLAEDFTEVIARMLLRKQMILEGYPISADMPNTDHWRDLYLNGYRGESPFTAMDTLRYNHFKAEVDGIVCLLLNHTDKRMFNMLEE